MCHMFFMHLYINEPPHHIFSIRRNHSLRNPKLNHNISNGCTQAVGASWHFLSNLKCIVDYIHLNTLFECLSDVSFVNPQHFNKTSNTTNWWTRNKHTYNFLAVISWICFGPTKWLLVLDFMLFKISWFCLIDYTLIRYSIIAFCRIVL
jgi:hypothetical protein